MNGYCVVNNDDALYPGHTACAERMCVDTKIDKHRTGNGACDKLRGLITLQMRAQTATVSASAIVMSAQVDHTCDE